MNTVEIVMSVHNEQDYIKEMIDSIINQTYKDWKLLIRNNASTDETETILRKYVRENPGKIILMDDNHMILPVYMSFGSILDRTTSQYVMYADGDDVWLPNKIELAVTKMKELEKKHSSQLPILVFTDSIIVDENLNSISNSMWKYQSLNPKNITLNRLLMHDVACGNTFIINRALLDRILPIPKDAQMHDIWTTLVAACFGVIDSIPESTILYRQHSDNVCGSDTIYRQLFFYLKNLKIIPSRIEDRKLLARELLSRFKNNLSPDQIDLINTLINLSNFGFFRRRFEIIRRSLYMNSLLRNIGLLIFC